MQRLPRRPGRAIAAWRLGVKNVGRWRAAGKGPIIFGEAYYNTRSKNYAFGIVELKLNADAEGEGVTIPAAKLSLDKEGQLVVETLPYTTGPQKLIGVRQWKDKKKDKDKK